MKTTNVTQLICTMLLSAALISCGAPAEKKETTTETPAAAAAPTPTETPAASTEVFKDFDWSTVPQSSAEIGAFPYLTAPEGFFIQDKGGWDESKTGYTELQDFNKLFIYTGNSFYNAEGKVAKMKFKMKEKDAEWNQYKFDSNVDRYLNTIGAKLLGKLKITDAQKAFLNKDDDFAIYNHIVGDPYNEPVRCYALNHTQGKIMIQVFSNTATGEVAVVQLQAFEQTIKPPSAVQMKKDIDANGKAILNINFDTDKSTLQPDGEKAVAEILALMKDNSELKIAIEGHTDNAGSADHNKKLSDERANAILKSLTGSGIAASRLTAKGYGAERPLVANDNEANMAKNRRVELVKK